MVPCPSLILHGPAAVGRPRQLLSGHYTGCGRFALVGAGLGTPVYVVALPLCVMCLGQEAELNLSLALARKVAGISPIYPGGFLM